MSKRKVDFNYSADRELIVCYGERNKYWGVGVARFNSDGIEEHPTRLTWQTVAHLKAERDILKQKLQDKKIKLKNINDFYIYMFPKKYTETLKDWLLPRADKYITDLKTEIKDIEAEIQVINDTIVTYLKDKEDFLKRLKKKREANKNGGSSSK